MGRLKLSRRSVRIATLCAVFVASFALPARAQYSSGLEGSVTDPTGAVIPGAQATLMNEATQVKQATVSNSAGFVQFLHLPPGRYQVTVVAKGFTTWGQKDIDIEGTDIRAIYPKLTVGSTQSSVEVSATNSMVETTSGTISSTLQESTIKEAPLVGQVLFASVATLAPGVTGLGGSFGGANGSGSQGTNSFNAEPAFQIIGAGQRQEANEYQLDGSTDDNQSRDGVVGITPEPDTVAQMKISADVFSADKGHQSGALIEIFTKPGTNKFHGTLSEFYTSSTVTARTEFQTKVPRFVRNDFGGTIGGPIVKDRTFFFGSLFWMQGRQGVTMVRPMETTDFVNYVTTNYPNSMAAIFFKNAPSGAVPTSGFQTVSQIEQKLQSPYPVPNIPGSLVALGNASISQSPVNNGFQGHVRLDHNFNNGNDKLFFSMFRNTTQGGVANPRPALAYVSPNSDWYAKGDYIHTFSTHFLNESSISFMHHQGFQPAAPGAILNNLPNASATGLGGGFSTWGRSEWGQNDWNWHDVVSYTRGNHNLRIGNDVDWQPGSANFLAGASRPSFSFANIVDFATDRPITQTGPFMDVQSGTNVKAQPSFTWQLLIAPFVQDDWKVTNRLTLNLGVRVDDFGNIISCKVGVPELACDDFVPGSGNTEEERIANGVSKQVAPSGVAVTSKVWRFAPRIGFAYDAFGNGRTSIHGGYGTFNTRLGDVSGIGGGAQAPRYATPTISIFTAGTTLANFSYAVSPSGASGFPAPPGLTYKVDSHGGLVGARVGVSGAPLNMTLPFVQNWAFGIQQAMGSSYVVEADYFGTVSRHLYFKTDANRFAGDLIQNNGHQQRLNQSFARISYGQSIGISNATVGSFSITKRFSKGWSVRGIYTFGKALDYTSSNDNGVAGAENIFDVNNPRLNYGRADYDARHRFSFDSVWNVPSMKGRIGNAITASWTLSPVVIIESGQPFTVYTTASYPSGDFNADGYNYDMPNVPTFGRTIRTHRSDFLKGVFAASAFPTPALGTEGNLGKNTYNGPGLANTNLSISRTFKLPFLGEQGGFDLRGEMLNLFNRVNLVNPVSDMSNLQFGHSTNQNLPRQIQVTGKIQF